MSSQTKYTSEGLAIVSEHTLHELTKDYQERSKKQVLRRHTDDVLKKISNKDYNFFTFATKQPDFVEDKLLVPVHQISVAGLYELLAREDEQALPPVSRDSVLSFERDIYRADIERRSAAFYSGLVGKLEKNKNIFLFFTAFFKGIAQKYLAADSDLIVIKIIAAQNYELLRRQAQSNNFEKQVFSAEGKHI